MDTCTLTIDGLEVTADNRKTILEAALENGIYIPHLCYHPDLEPVGVCRLCMVEIEGKGMVISCETPVEDNLVVWTESPEVDKVRRIAVNGHWWDTIAAPTSHSASLSPQDVTDSKRDHYLTIAA